MGKIFNRWPVKVIIFETRQSGVNIVVDKGKRIETKLKEFQYKLKKLKITTRPIEYDYIFANNWLLLKSPDPETYVPYRYDPKDEVLKLLDPNVRQWTIMRLRTMWERYNPKGFWDKWAWVFVILFVSIGLMMIFWVNYQGYSNLNQQYQDRMIPAMQKVADSLNAVADKIDMACRANATTLKPPPA